MKKNVLVVEDAPFLVRAFEAKLGQAGIKTMVARDGEEALELLKQQTPDLVLLDLMLPKTDGFKVLEAIRADERLRDIPVIVVSNLGQPKDVRRAKELGATEYLIKSETPIALVAKKVEGYLAGDSPVTPLEISKG